MEPVLTRVDLKKHGLNRHVQRGYFCRQMSFLLCKVKVGSLDYATISLLEMDLANSQLLSRRLGSNKMMNLNSHHLTSQETTVSADLAPGHL